MNANHATDLRRKIKGRASTTHYTCKQRIIWVTNCILSSEKKLTGYSGIQIPASALNARRYSDTMGNLAHSLYRKEKRLIAPLDEATSSQKCSPDMAGIVKGCKSSHSLTCTPKRLSTNGMNHTCLCLPSWSCCIRYNKQNASSTTTRAQCKSTLNKSLRRWVIPRNRYSWRGQPNTQQCKLFNHAVVQFSVSRLSVNKLLSFICSPFLLLEGMESRFSGAQPAEANCNKPSNLSTASVPFITSHVSFGKNFSILHSLTSSMEPV